MKQERIQRSDDRERLISILQHPSSAFWLLAFASPFLFFVPITHDEIWHIWIGQQMLGGARLYRDIVEVNPPLWFWMGMPLAATGLDPRTSVVGLFIAATGLALWLTPRRYRIVVLGTLVILPLHDFGQREHFTLIATVPYVFLAAERANGQSVKHPIAVGLFAAFGFALKPYFVLVPLALEFTMRRHLRPETVALGCCAVLYAVALPLIAPEYLTSIVPLVREAYGAFGGGQYVILALFSFAFAIAGIALGKRAGDATSRALFLAAVAFLVAAVIQGKGWAYQTLPARGFLFLAAANELWRMRLKPLPDALLFGAALTCFLPIGVYENQFTPEVERHLAGIPRGSSVVVLANNPSVAWPMVYDHGLRWELPEMSTWQVQALPRSPELRPVARKLADVGLLKQPDLLLVDLDPRYAADTVSLLPPHYLEAYKMRLGTRRFVSYTRANFTTEPK